MIIRYHDDEDYELNDDNDDDHCDLRRMVALLGFRCGY